jgi:hypothetical protein
MPVVQLLAGAPQATENSDPLTAIANTDTVFENALAVYRNSPLGLTAIPTGAMPVLQLQATGASDPSAAIENTEIVSAPLAV